MSGAIETEKKKVWPLEVPINNKRIKGIIIRSHNKGCECDNNECDH